MPDRLDLPSLLCENRVVRRGIHLLYHGVNTLGVGIDWLYSSRAWLFRTISRPRDGNVAAENPLDPGDVTRRICISVYVDSGAVRCACSRVDCCSDFNLNEARHKECDISGVGPDVVAIKVYCCECLAANGVKNAFSAVASDVENIFSRRAVSRKENIVLIV